MITPSRMTVKIRRAPERCPTWYASSHPNRDASLKRGTVPNVVEALGIAEAAVRFQADLVELVVRFASPLES